VLALKNALLRDFSLCSAAYGQRNCRRDPVIIRYTITARADGAHASLGHRGKEPLYWFLTYADPAALWHVQIECDVDCEAHEKYEA
jgi:hypothetical protein